MITRIYIIFFIKESWIFLIPTLGFELQLVRWDIFTNYEDPNLCFWNFTIRLYWLYTTVTFVGFIRTFHSWKWGGVSRDGIRQRLISRHYLYLWNCALFLQLDGFLISKSLLLLNWISVLSHKGRELLKLALNSTKLQRLDCFC